MEWKCGTFCFDPPPNVYGYTIRIPNAQWRQCSSCGETIIDHELWRRLDEGVIYSNPTTGFVAPPSAENRDTVAETA